jgi:hypothetical protein
MLLQRLFILLSALWLLLCVATLVIWIPSTWYDDSISYCNAWWQCSVESSLGRISLGYAREYRVPDVGAIRWICRSRLRPHFDNPRPGILGFSYANTNWVTLGDTSGRPSTHTVEISVPHWFVIAIAAIPPLACVRRLRRIRRRKALGLCATCGYDLRASKDRCPECGNIIQREP